MRLAVFFTLLFAWPILAFGEQPGAPAEQPAGTSEAAAGAPVPVEPAAEETAAEAPAAESPLQRAAVVPAQSPWEIPEPGACHPQQGLLSAEGRDAEPLPFGPGDAIALEQLDVIRNFIPPDIWEHRDKFFFEGMRLVIGECFADYGPPAFFREATAKFAGQASLNEDGGLENYTAGLPFAPDGLASDDPRVGLEWAWNFEQRYQGAGFGGDFRTSDMVGRAHRAEPFIGEIFKIQLAYRSDRPEDDYTAPGSKSKHWVAGGLMKEPFNARHASWRQYRDVEHLTSPDRSDDVHAYLPDLRRVRRIASSGIEGLYMPAFNIGAVKAQSLAVGGGGALGGISGGVGAVSGGGEGIKTKRSGFEGLEMRPLLYDVKLLGVQDILAPINSVSPMYPEKNERDFGAWGLSFASDTWDLRRALVIEGFSKDAAGGSEVARQIFYLDLQTLYPLYYMSWDSRDERLDIGMFVGRWSESRDDYPRWPDDDAREVRVIDPVGAAFANLQEAGGWRRESWTIVSTPPNDRTVKREVSVNNLTKRR